MNDTATEKLFEFYMVSPRGKRISPINFLSESDLGQVDAFNANEQAATPGTKRRWVAVPH